MGFVDRLVSYLEGPLGAPGFRERMEGYPETVLRDFEAAHFGGPIPAEFREYLLRMGRRPADFTLLADDAGGFDAVREWYEEGDEPGLPPLPRGDSILIAVGNAAELFLDGSLEGRPVFFHSRRPSLFRVADAFDLYCMQLAWIRFKFERLGPLVDFALAGAQDGPVERAVEEALRAGLRPEPCWDSVNRLFSRDGIGLYLRRREERWEGFIRSQDPGAAKALAAAVAR
ncbi:MAG: hypothetical protein HY553_11915 [Elusimicrobia bacterium]|nr:hypothetical protein [Elusimicrobiota bacterium]